MSESHSTGTAADLAQWVVRLTGMTQVVLGLLFWNGRALARTRASASRNGDRRAE